MFPFTYLTQFSTILHQSDLVPNPPPYSKHCHCERNLSLERTPGGVRKDKCFIIPPSSILVTEWKKGGTCGQKKYETNSWQDTAIVAGWNLCAIQKDSTTSVGVQFKLVPGKSCCKHAWIKLWRKWRSQTWLTGWFHQINKWHPQRWWYQSNPNLKHSWNISNYVL